MQEKIGHYTIVSELGRGGMGIVYKAHEESLNRFVAIKVLTEKLTEDDTFLQRFVREARAAAGVSHPNIVQIYFIGEDGDHPYFVMEYVSGQSLNRLLRTEGRIGNPRAAQLILQAAHGLAAAHDRGIIHRDIKPANLMLDERGMVKIADFGLALPADAEKRLTATGLLMGTPGYLAPEQCRGEKIDHRTDIYALGVTFYELLSGTTPFKGESPLALLRQILDEEAPDISLLHPDVDEETRRIVAKMIAKNRDLRYQSCHDIVTDLEEYLSQHGVRSVTAGLATKTGATAPGVSPAAMQATQVLFSGATPAPSATHDAPTALISSPEPITQPEVAFREPDTIVPRTPTVAAPIAPPMAPVVAAAAMPLMTPPAAAAPAPAYAAVPPNVAAAAAAPPPRSSRGPILLIILAVFLLGGAGLAFVGYKAYGRYVAAREQITSAFNTATSTTSTSSTTTATTTSTNASALTATPTAGELLSNQMNPSQSAGSSDTAAAPGQVPAQLAATPAPSAAGAPAPATHRPSPNEVTRGPMTRDPVAASNVAASAVAAPPQHAAAPAHSLSGVAVAVTGDGALLGPVASVLTSELEGAGLQATDAATLPATEDVLRHGNVSASNLIDRLRHEGHAVLVLARVDPTGQRDLNFMGRSDTAYSARVTITAYDLATGRPLGSGKNATIEYTSRTADRESEKVIGPLARQVIETIPGH